MKPQIVTDVDLAFPANVMHLMPKMEEIPVEFKKGKTKWNEFFSGMFYTGKLKFQVIPKEGINGSEASRHILCIMRSFEPKHEHKEAACAYLFSLWFEEISNLEVKK